MDVKVGNTLNVILDEWANWATTTGHFDRFLAIERRPTGTFQSLAFNLA